MNNSFNIKVADFVFAIDPLNQNIVRFFAGYLTEESAEAVIAVTRDEIEYERVQMKKTAEIEGHPYRNCSSLSLEFIAISRKISDYISFHNCSMFHGALIEKEGKGYLFTARSGTGKTTHIMNWMKRFCDVIVVNGDKPFLRVEPGGIYGYGTPWCGKENMSTNKRIKVDNLIILERDTTNHIERVHYTDYMNQLFAQVYIPGDAGGMARTFQVIHGLAKTAKLYRLGCNMEVESATVAYAGMNV